jgi:hypothetical protein
MLIWTAIIIINIILTILGGGFSYSYGVNPAGVTTP